MSPEVVAVSLAALGGAISYGVLLGRVRAIEATLERVLIAIERI